ncbi:peptidoglycan-binding protein [Streptomyces sp. Wb2n-11]|uniref:peptidoglycan-binding domain-containing protein n=1 Tax=Streptomyces sp. Wb2n-11 TaxID=1030533 RepID=UPI000A66C66E|nr:peptidoglycan-binding domain-containing protein [Streptomyces sp. Wb2n-11]
MNGHICPECGTGRGAASDDAGRPGCGCAERTARAVRAERSAEIAAAEDFDPLRIRPYVTLQETDAGAPLPSSSYAGPGGEAAMTMPPEVLDGPGGGPGDDATGAAGTTALMGAVPSYGPPSGAGPAHGSGSGGEPPEPRGRQRKGPVPWLAVGAAAAAVVGTAVFAGGLFSGDDERERALPDTVTGVPSASDGPETSASESGAGSRSPTPSPSASASASVSPSASASTSTSAEASAPVSASASASRSAAASPSASAGSSKPAAPATPSAVRTTTTAEEPPEPAATLRRGDRGPEVAELQDRLAQLWLYRGRRNGRFDGRVEEAVRTYQSYKYIQGDPEGTYGPHTRRALEAETEEP